MNIKKKWILRFLLLLSSLIFILYGAKRNEIEIVLNKAVNICFECIGLG